jgi:hypothetical protein
MFERPTGSNNVIPSSQIPLAVVKKFSDDSAGSLAALIAYYGFLAPFPLLLLFTTVLGLVLQGDIPAQNSIIHFALTRFPLVGTQLRAHSPSGSRIALAVAIVGTLLSGLGVATGGDNAYNQLYAVPPRKRPSFLQSRLRGLGGLTVRGLLQVFSTVVWGAVSGGLGGLWLVVAGIAVSRRSTSCCSLPPSACSPTTPSRPVSCGPGSSPPPSLREILRSAGGLYRRARTQTRLPRLRHVRHRHRPDQLAAPRCAGGDLLGPAEQGAPPRPLAPEHVRRRARRGQAGFRPHRQDRGADHAPASTRQLWQRPRDEHLTRMESSALGSLSRTALY